MSRRSVSSVKLVTSVIGVLCSGLREPVIKPRVLMTPLVLDKSVKYILYLLILLGSVALMPHRILDLSAMSSLVQALLITVICVENKDVL